MNRQGSSVAPHLVERALPAQLSAQPSELPLRLSLYEQVQPFLHGGLLGLESAGLGVREFALSRVFT